MHKLLEVNNICKGFISMYSAVYELGNGKNYDYNFTSRKNDHTIDTMGNAPVSAVAIFCTNLDNSKALLIREHRMPLNKTILEIPAGLIDPGESPEDAAVRELREETGYDAVVTKTMLPAYSSPGLTDESVIIVICQSDEGFFSCSDLGDTEHIEAFWATKEEAKELLNTEIMGVRSQLLLDNWVNSN